MASGMWHVASGKWLHLAADPTHCLICNCQPAATADSRIDSLLSLLILIVAFCFPMGIDPPCVACTIYGLKFSIMFNLISKH